MVSIPTVKEPEKRLDDTKNAKISTKNAHIKNIMAKEGLDKYPILTYIYRMKGKK